MSTLHSLGFAKGEAETTLIQNSHDFAKGEVMSALFSDFDFAFVKLYL